MSEACLLVGMVERGEPKIEWLWEIQINDIIKKWIKKIKTTMEWIWVADSMILTLV